MIKKILLSDIGKLLYESLDNFADWNFVHSKYTIEHKPTGMKLWIDSGWIMFDNYDRGHEVLTVCDRYIVWNKYRKIKQQYINKKLGEYYGFRRIKEIG